MLKSSIIGGVSAGITPAMSGLDLGTVGNIAAKTGVQTGLAAISGGDVGQAAVSGLINGILPVALTEILPADTMSAFNALPDSVKKVALSTAGSVLNAGFNGTDISDAATSGVVNGIISLSKDFVKGGFNSLTESELAQTVKGYFNPSTGAGGFLGSYEDLATAENNPDVVDSIFRQDGQDVLERNIPPLVQNTINRNTPVTAETVTTPPLIQEAMNQNVSADDINNAFAQISNEQVQQGGLSTLGGSQIASATNSDANPVGVGSNEEVVTTLPTTTVTADQDEEDETTDGRFSVDEQALNLFNDILREEGRSDLLAESLSDPRLLDFVNRANERIDSSNGLPAGLYTIGQAGQVSPPEGLLSASGEPLRMDASIKEVFDSILAGSTDSESPAFIDANKMPIAEALYSSGLRGGATPEQAQELVNRFLQNPNNIEALRSDITRFVNVDLSSPQAVIETLPPLTQVAQDTSNTEQTKQEQTKAEKDKTKDAPKDNSSKGGSGTQGGALAGNKGQVGAASSAPSSDSSSSSFAEEQASQAVSEESENVAAAAAESGEIEPADIPIVTANLSNSSTLLNLSPTAAVEQGLVQSDGSLSDAGAETVAAAAGLTVSEVKALENASTTSTGTTTSSSNTSGSGLNTSASTSTGSSTIREGSGSTTTSTVGGGSTGSGTGVSGTGGTGGNAGTGAGGQGTGVGTGSGSGSGSGTGGGGAGSYGGARLTINPQYPGALPGNLEGTYLKGVEVDEYDPFANYNVYRQLEPVRAAQGGSPLQLMQMQQGIVGYDPSSYSNVQFRPTPEYFTYGSKPEQPTTFAGSQLMGKPKPSIPVTPTGNIGSNDWLYGAAGSNQLSPAGGALPPLASGMMAEGGQAHGGGEGEHVPEFITGATGHYVKGRGDGQADMIPAMLASGEFVWDADTVAALGNGDSDSGAKILDGMRQAIRAHKRSAPIDKIPPKAKSPLQYMKDAEKYIQRDE
jgi:hypothetical protein